MLIFSKTSTARLQYICKFIFGEQLGIGFSLTIDSEGFKNHEGPKINYSDIDITGEHFTLQNHNLLFEKNIKAQTIECFDSNGKKAFFKTDNSDFSFDIFAASFYLLSRYEEYLTHEKDLYGRYAHENAIAFKEGFLQEPIINQWLLDFAAALKQKFPSLQIKSPEFKFTPTYDIDIAWSYKHKGLLRNLGGFLKSPSITRLSVLTGLKKDPYDVYEFLNELHTNNQLDPIYFFLVATSRGEYDKNISPYDHAMWQLIKQHEKKYRIGLHPSWLSNEKHNLLAKEKRVLETAGKIEIIRSRQHYIKLTLPETYNRLIENGISNEYSMGYGSINGFRASVASSFFWYDLQAEKITSLRVYPFCFMDANSFYEQKQNAKESLAELLTYYQKCKAANGEMISIFHNNFLGTDALFAGWKELYVEFISQLRQ
ncbi:MAG: hypothetical protein EOP53_18725 [Sphingobacteriales bacterium]|nr:MAG: hypothetical protein EOP53_18725 [Sphingobacteriales bacterium]